MEIKKTTGYTAEEMLKIAKRYCPKIITPNIEEKDDYFDMKLEISENKFLSTSILKSSYRSDIKPADEKRLLKKIKSETEEEIKNKIKKYGLELADFYIKEFELEEILKDRYEDKNVIYKVRRHNKISKHATATLEAFYYMSFQKLLPNYELLWNKIILEEIDHEHRDKVIEYIHGASERFKQLLFSRDRIKDIYEKYPSGNDSVFLINFHFYHFVSLVKTLGDNLTWILKFYYEMPVGDTNFMKVDLVKKGFRDWLEGKNKLLHDSIYKHPKFSDFEKLKDYRDIIQHRHGIHISNVMIGLNGPEKIMVPKQPEFGVEKSLRKNFDEGNIKKYFGNDSKESIAKYGLKEMCIWIDPPEGMPWIEPTVFCDQYITFLTEIFNESFEHIIKDLES